MKSDYDVSFLPPHPGAVGNVVREIAIRLAFGEGELAGLAIELTGIRLRRRDDGELYVTWPALYRGRAGWRRYSEFVRGADSPEARRRLVEMFKSREQSG